MRHGQRNQNEILLFRDSKHSGKADFTVEPHTKNGARCHKKSALNLSLFMCVEVMMNKWLALSTLATCVNFKTKNGLPNYRILPNLSPGLYIISTL